MSKKGKYKYIGLMSLALTLGACNLPVHLQKDANKSTPSTFANQSADSTNSAQLKWSQYFQDPYLAALIDTALKNNQELNITLQEIEIARNEVRARKGEYLPFVGLQAGAGVDKVSKNTIQGATEDQIRIKEDKPNPDPMGDFAIGLYANWELDVWKKLHNAKKAAVNRYLASVEGRNFVVTNLVAEVANSYYELLALDNQLEIVHKNIEIQTNALEIVRLQKQAARVTELAVRKFEAEVLKTQSLQFGIQQQITETENRINFLLARYPQPIQRNDAAFTNATLPMSIKAGVPSQLLANRPDIRRAEQELEASKLDVSVAKAAFYPSLAIHAGAGFQAFNPSFLFTSPESMIFSLAGDLIAPLVNRNAIKANFRTANARQVQAAYEYERTILNSYVEVANLMSRMNNLDKSYDLKSKQVDALTQSIGISNDLFKATRADYMEVLLTQRDALESRFELIETRQQQMRALVNMYQALGGGWN
jgi:NodT family efflux transporter outer membrane factor (OMF) lipoprotein